MKKLAKRFRGFLPVVIDIETAGFDPEKNALLEIAAVFVEYGPEGMVSTDVFHEHVKPEPGLELDPDALAFTEIIPDHPFRLAVTEKEMLEGLASAVEAQCAKLGCSRAVLVGHNGQFDLSFLQAAARRQGVQLPFHRFLVFDTATLSAALLGETVLARAVRRSGSRFNDQEAHSALYDATVTAQLFAKLINQADAGLYK